MLNLEEHIVKLKKTLLYYWKNVILVNTRLSDQDYQRSLTVDAGFPPFLELFYFPVSFCIMIFHSKYISIFAVVKLKKNNVIFQKKQCYISKRQIFRWNLSQVTYGICWVFPLFKSLPFPCFILYNDISHQNNFEKNIVKFGKNIVKLKKTLLYLEKRQCYFIKRQTFKSNCHKSLTVDAGVFLFFEVIVFLFHSVSWYFIPKPLKKHC